MGDPPDERRLAGLARRPDPAQAPSHRRPGAGNPHYFPEQLAAGLTVHHVSAVYLSGTLEPNCWVDIGDDIETKIDALFCHESQLTETGEWFREFLRERAEEGGRAAGVRYAEGFRRLAFAV